MDKSVKEVGPAYFASGARTARNIIQIRDEFKAIEINHAIEVERSKEQYTPNPNVFVPPLVISIANEIAIDPATLEYIMDGAFLKCVRENEAFRKQFEKMVLQAKLTYPEEIAEFKARKAQEIERLELQVQRDAQQALKAIKIKLDSNNRRVLDRQRSNNASVNKFKEYVVETVGEILDGLESLDDLGPRNKRFIEILRMSGLIVKENGRFEFLTMRFMNEMPDNEYLALTMRLHAALSPQSPS